MQHCLTGKHIPETVLTIRKADGSPLEYLCLTLQGMIIINVTPVGFYSMRSLREKVGLSFSRVTIDSVLQNAEGNPAGTVSTGYVGAECIIVKIFSQIERGKLDKVNGIIAHQTEANNADSTFYSYRRGGTTGAHFLIDPKGEIYQTASLYNTARPSGIGINAI